MTTIKKEFIEVDTDTIIVKKRLRETMGDLSTLRNSIEKVGLLNPIIIDRDGVLVAGLRRYEACRELGLHRLPVARLDISHDSMDALDIQSAENLCRLALSGDELEKQIELKKALLSRGDDGTSPGFLTRLKALFTGA